MTIAEQIRAWREKIGANVKAQSAIMERAANDEDGRTLLAEEQKAYDTLQAEIESAQGTIARLEQLAKNLAETAPAAGTENTDTSAAELQTAERKSASFARNSAPALVRGLAEDKFEGQSFTRLAIAKAVAMHEGISPISVALKRWGKTAPHIAQILKADIEGHSGQSGDPGAELVNATVVADFVNYLHGQTVFDRLDLAKVPANVRVNGQDLEATGYWVGEGRAIKPSETSYFTGVLSPLKAAGLAVVTNEWLRDATPDGEKLIRDSLAEAVAKAVDTKFFSADAAGTGSPAGILQGLTSLGSNGYDLDAVYEDVRELFEYFITYKNAGGKLNFVMSKGLAQAIALMRTPLGVKAFPDLTREGGMFEGVETLTGDNVGDNKILLIKPRDVYRIGSDALSVEVSRHASIEMADDAAQDVITPTAATGKVVNMFQTESTAIKVVRDINFARRRSAGSVAFIGDAYYGDASSTTA